MYKTLSQKIYEARMIKEATTQELPKFSKAGINADYLNKLDDSIKESEKTASDYQFSFTEGKNLTRLQNDLVESCKQTMTILKRFAGHFIDDQKILERFYVNKSYPTQLNQFILYAQNMDTSAREFSDLLTQGGIDIAILDQFENDIEKLKTMDNEQEQAKKNLKLSKIERNKKIKNMVNLYSYIQNIAFTLFKGNPQLRDKFLYFHDPAAKPEQTNQEQTTNSQTAQQ